MGSNSGIRALSPADRLKSATLETHSIATKENLWGVITIILFFPKKLNGIVCVCLY
jgi:hypothetical protein